MAIIRQKTQAFNQPIGVVRADAGAQDVGRAISRAADSFSDRMYRKAAEEAKKKGQEKALAISSSEIAAIDPNTNKPVAYNPPAQYGTIASAAYQDIIDRRFEDSITLELQAKGAEFAKDSSSAAQYRDRLSNYVGQMYDAEGEDTFYKRYVEEAGAAYVQKTFSALRKKEIDAVRARAKKEEKLSFAREIISIQSEIDSGQMTPELEARIQDIQLRSMAGYLAGANTISDVTKAADFARGFTALSANSELASIYRGSSEVEQAQIKLALRDPMGNHLDDPVLTELTRNVLMGEAGATEVISALDANEKDLQDMAEAINLDFVESNPVTPDMSFAKVATLYKNQSLETRSQAYEKLFTLKIDEDLSPENLDLIINELKKPKALIDDNVFPEAARGIVRSMTEEDISELATNLSGRQTNLSGIKAQELKTSLQNAALGLERIASSTDITGAGKEYQSTLDAISLITDPTKKRDKRTAAESEFSLKVSQLVDPTTISADRLSEIHGEIKQNATSIEGTPDEVRYFNTLSKAYKLSRTTIEARMGTFEAERAKDIQATIDRTTLESAESKANAGRPLSATERESLESKLYPNGAIPAPQTLLKDANFRSRAVQNSILDAEFTAIEQGLLSTDQETQIAAFDLFRQLQKVQQDTGPEIVDRNLILGKVDEETYNSANAAVIISSLSGDAPNVVMANMMAYSGSTDAVIRDGLGIKSMNDLFTDPDLKLTGFSSAAQEEFKAVLRYAVASDQPVNVETLKKMKKSYTSLMVEDDFVLGARVGDKSRYAVALAFGDTEAREAIRYVVSEMADDPKLKPYLEDIGLAGRVMSSGGLNYENQVLGSLQKYMKLDPIKETWVGDDSNKSYIVKILSTGGGYVTMEKDGFPIIISQSQFVEEETDERSLFSYNNALTAAVNSGNKRGTAKAGLEYLIKLDPEIYTDLESVRNIPRDDYFINDQLSDEEVQQIIEEMQRGQ